MNTRSMFDAVPQKYADTVQAFLRLPVAKKTRPAINKRPDVNGSCGGCIFLAHRRCCCGDNKVGLYCYAKYRMAEGRFKFAPDGRRMVPASHMDSEVFKEK